MPEETTYVVRTHNEMWDLNDVVKNDTCRVRDLDKIYIKGSPGVWYEHKNKSIALDNISTTLANSPITTDVAYAMELKKDYQKECAILDNAVQNFKSENKKLRKALVELCKKMV